MSLSVILVCIVNLFWLAQRTEPCKQSGQISETDIRRMATETHLPSYPEDAKNNQITGIAVVELHINEANRIDTVKVIEAPSKSIAEAAKASILQWKFSPPRPRDTVICLRGKLTFYFVIENGKPYVKNPRRYESVRK